MAGDGFQGELRPVEFALVAHLESGELLDLTDHAATVTKAEMRSWGPDRTIRAWVLRNVLLGRLAPNPDPQGILPRHTGGVGAR